MRSISGCATRSPRTCRGRSMPEAPETRRAKRWGMGEDGISDRDRSVRGFSPPETSPLSPLPSPSHRAGEGDSAEAMVAIGGVFVEVKLLKHLLQALSPQTRSPLPVGGRAMGEGTGVRFRRADRTGRGGASQGIKPCSQAR